MSEIAGILGADGQAYAERIARLQGIAELVIPRLADIAWCNDQFAAHGRADLNLNDPVVLPQFTAVPNPINLGEVGNFVSDLKMYSDSHSVIVHGEVSSWSEEQPVPVNRNYLLALRDGRIAPPRTSYSHMSKPAFLRALCIEPELLIETVVRLSTEGTYISPVGPEVLVVHGIMSRLVDRSDRSAARADGKVNIGYLCSSHALEENQE